MTELSLGWAVVGKWPGSRDEQSVIAASAQPFTSSQLHRLVAQSSPGNLPSMNESGAAALPWVWLANARLNDVAYLCIAVASWAGAADAFQRAIAHTRYFFLPLEDFLATSMTLTDLYATVSDVHLPIEDSTSAFSPDKILVECRTGDPSWTSPLSPEVAAVAAAQVIEQPVALLGGRSLALGARLAALDSVRELLPAGALRWLTTACWATGSHPIRLFFTDQPRGTEPALPIRGTPPAPSGPAADYGHALDRLRERYGRAGVVAHLRNLVNVQDKDIGAIQGSLSELDLVSTVEEAARSHALDLAQARRLHTNGPFVLSESQKLVILGEYLTKATAHDIRAGHGLLTTQWTDSLGPHLARAAAAGLHTRNWRAEDLEALADVAEQGNAFEAFLSGLRARSTRRSGTELEVVWTTVLQLAGRAAWHASLAGFVAPQADLSVQAAEILHSRIRPPDPFYEALDGVGEHTAWARIRRVFLPEAATPPATQADVTLVMDTNPDIIPRLLRGGILPLAPLLAGLLPYLDQKRSLLWKSEWEQALLGAPGLSVVHEAWLDFVLYRAGRPPIHRLPHRPEYVTALVARSIEANIPQAQRSELVDQAVRALPKDWLVNPDTYVPVLDALWRLGTAPDGADHSIPHVLVSQLERELGRRPNLLDDERLRPWSQFFRDLNGFGETAAVSSFAGLAETTPTEVVVDLIANIVTNKRPPKVTNLVAELRSSRWRPRPDEWPHFVIAVQFQLRQRRHKGADALCVQLTEELVKVLGDQSLTELTEVMAAYAQTMASGLKAVEKRFPNSIEANRSEVSEVIRTVDSLRPKPSKFNFWSPSRQRSDDPLDDHAPTTQLSAKELGHGYGGGNQPDD